ncbi:MAG: tRNA (adenosine(37)-N6)-dimethylallyltransferase MiaA [Bacteroidota bacterium]
MKQHLIVIAGPTASGKTALSVALAKQLKCPVISADSRQFYKEMSIGTAKPTRAEMKGVPHFFIDSHSIEAPLSAGTYERLALKRLEQLFRKHEHVVLVGGSGMFIDAVIHGTDQLPHSREIQLEWNEFYNENGLEGLQEQLREKDPEYYQEVDENNPVRLIRALEVISITGTPFSQLRSRSKKRRPFNTHYFAIDVPRETLYERINQRVLQMIENGLESEARGLLSKKEYTALNTVGYKEFFQYFNDEIERSEAISLIQRNTRRYAKRQMTWLRKNPSIQWIAFDETDQMLKSCLSKLDNAVS